MTIRVQTTCKDSFHQAWGDLLVISVPHFFPSHGNSKHFPRRSRRLISKFASGGLGIVSWDDTWGDQITFKDSFHQAWGDLLVISVPHFPPSHGNSKHFSHRSWKIDFKVCLGGVRNCDLRWQLGFQTTFKDSCHQVWGDLLTISAPGFFSSHGHHKLPVCAM